MKPRSSYEAPVFFSLLHRFTLRYWRRHWLKLALLVSIVGLGTGAFLAIGLANRAATQSFDRFAQTVSGQSQIVVTPALGDFSLTDLKQIRRALLDSEAAIVPQIVADARIAGRADLPESLATFTIIGMDLLAASNFLLRHDAADTFLGRPDSDAAPLEFAAGAYSQEDTAAAYGWKQGSELSLYIGDQVHTLPWAGVLPKLESDIQAAANVLIMDWQELSDLLSRPLFADRVDLVWTGEYKTKDAISRAMDELVKANPGTWVIESQAQRQQTGATMTFALRMNLRALSALSLLVAVFLVFQAMDSAIARRQGEVATLHSLGVSKRTTQLLWIADSAFVGILGGGCGLLFGFGMAQISTKLVSQTVNTLYYNAGDASLDFAPSEALLAWLLTVGFCVVAGWWPARQAARSPLVETIRQGSRRSTYSRKAYLIAALSFAALSVIAYLIPPLQAENGHGIPAGGYALAIFLIGFVASLACLSLEFLGSMAKRLSPVSVTAGLALSQFRLPVTRHRLALSGVALSVGMTAAMVFLIGSFETTVRSWISNTLQADLFIRPKSVASAHTEATLSLSLLEAIRADRRVSDVGTIHSTPIRIHNLPTQLIGFDTEYLDRIDHTTWIERPTRLLDLQNGGTAIVNEAFANRFDKSVGDRVQLPANDGERSLEIIGVYADYGNENGSLGIDRTLFVELTGQPRPRAVAMHLHSPSEIRAYASELEAAYPGLFVMTNRWLRQESLRIFNRVFSITYALEAIGLAIAIAGLGSMLASLLVERRAETSALQRIGFGPSKIAYATASEGLALSTIAVFAGLALGLLLGLVLVYIINRQSFGWTLAAVVPWPSLILLTFLTLGGAAVTSYLVGKWSSKLPLVVEE